MKEEVKRWMEQALYELNPEWIPSRYPDTSVNTPAKDYNYTSAKIHLQKARKVVTWVKKQTKR